MFTAQSHYPMRGVCVCGTVNNVYGIYSISLKYGRMYARMQAYTKIY